MYYNILLYLKYNTNKPLLGMVKMFGFTAGNHTTCCRYGKQKPLAFHLRMAVNTAAASSKPPAAWKAMGCSWDSKVG